MSDTDGASPADRRAEASRGLLVLALVAGSALAGCDSRNSMLSGVQSFQAKLQTQHDRAEAARQAKVNDEIYGATHPHPPPPASSSAPSDQEDLTGEGFSSDAQQDQAGAQDSSDAAAASPADDQGDN